MSYNCPQPKIDPNELIGPRLGSDIAREFDYMGAAKQFKRIYDARLTCLSKWEKKHAPGALLMYHFIKSFVIEKRSGAYKDVDFVPPAQDMLKELNPAYYEIAELDRSFANLATRLVAFIKSQKFLEEFYQLDRAMQLEMKRNLCVDLSLSHQGEIFLRQSIHFDPGDEESLYYQPDTDIENYLRNTSPEDRYYYPIFSFQLLEHDFDYLEANKTSSTAAEQVFTFLSQIVPFILKSKKLFLFVIARAIDMYLDKEIQVMAGTRVHQIVNLDTVDTYLQGLMLEDRPFKAGTPTIVKTGVNAFFAFLAFSSSLYKVFDKDLTIKSGFDLFATTTALTKELLDIRAIAKQINPHSAYYRSTGVGAFHYRLGWLLTRVIAPLVVLYEASNVVMELEDDRPRAALASFLMGVAVVASYFGIIALVFIGAALIVIYVIDSDEEIRIQEWFPNNYLGKNWSETLANASEYSPVELEFEWVNPGPISTPNIPNQIASLLSMVFPMNLKVTAPVQFESNLRVTPRYFNLTIEFEEPRFPYHDFLLKLRFFSDDSEEKNVVWDYEGNRFTNTSFDFILPVEAQPRSNKPSWWTADDWWYESDVFEPSTEKGDASLIKGIKKFTLSIRMPLSSRDHINYIMVELVNADIFGIPSKQEALKAFERAQNPFRIRDAKPINWILS